jgi:capsid protein
MPFNIAMGNSSSYNYSSGQLDHGTYDGANEIDRRDIELKLLDRILARWLDEAMRIPGYMYSGVRAFLVSAIPHEWLWRRRQHGDPEKDAAATQTRLTSFESTLEDEWLRKGLDPETQWKKLEEQTDRLKKLGLTIGQVAQAAAKPAEDKPQEPQPQDQKSTDASPLPLVIANRIRNGNGVNGVH